MGAEIKTEQQLKIMRQYAAGAELVDISEKLGVDRDTVAGTVSTLAGFGRGRARELVRQYEAAHNHKPAAAAPSPPVAPQPAATLGDSTSSLLAKAEQSGNARLVKQAERIRQSVATLAEMLAGWEQRAEAERKVAELRRQLAEAEAQLRRASGSVAPTKAAQRGQRATTSREMRAWAKQNGIECNALGIIPARVVEAYRAAHPEVSGG